MAERQWLGGASPVAQDETFTPANVEVGDIFTLTATAEDGTTTAAVNFTATLATVANVTAGLTTAWNNSTDALHTYITATDNTTNVGLTVDSGSEGRPFYVASSTTDGGGTNNQTLTRAVVTASAGPNDWNTAANWSGATVPVATDDVKINKGSHSILYGLDQSSVALTSLRTGKSYTGVIGQSDNSYYLHIDATDAFFNSRGQATWWDGTSTTTYVQGGVNSANMLQRKGTIGTLYVTGTDVSGTVTVANGSDLTLCYLTDATGGKLVIDENVTSISNIVQTGGTVELSSATGSMTCSGGKMTVKEGGSVSGSISCTGGEIEYLGTGTIVAANIFAGSLTTGDNTGTSLTITNLTIFGGTYSDLGALGNITYTNDIVKHGGKVTSDIGKTIDPNA